MTINELSAMVQEKAHIYVTESGDEIEQFPEQVVDYVVEFAINESHFPLSFSDDKIATRLSRCVNTLAMMCVEVYSRMGAEGEKAHSENAISRTFDGTWISARLIDALPNYVEVI